MVREEQSIRQVPARRRGRRRNRLTTDAVREIRFTFSRFLSILVLSALAVAFLAGLRTTAPDMEYTADNYYDRTHMMDGYVISTLGLTQEDLDALGQEAGIQEVEGGMSLDATARDAIVSVRSLPETLNLLEVTEGRLPQAADEALHHDDGQGVARDERPVGAAVRHGEGQQHAGDNGGEVAHGDRAAHDKADEGLAHDAGRHGDDGEDERPFAVEVHRRDEGRGQRYQHVQHEPAGVIFAADMGRGGNSEIHAHFPPFSMCFACTKVSVSGSLPGQTNEQQPHSMQSLR